MKRIIAVLLAVVLLSGISLSAAEEPQVSADFLQALAAWAQNLNLDESDYAGSVKWLDSPGYQGTVRKNQGSTETELAGLGKVQVSENKLMLDIGGKKFGVDLSKLKDMVKSYSSGEKGLLKDLEMLRPWLERAFKEIVLPCVKINYSLDGVSIHIDADDEKIKELEQSKALSIDLGVDNFATCATSLSDKDKSNLSISDFVISTSSIPHISCL